MHTLKGKIEVINEAVQISDNFKKREFVVLDASGKYPQTILLQAVQDRTKILDAVKVGDEVEVTFFLRGRKWEDPKKGETRYFNSLDAWKVEAVVTEKKPPSTTTTHGDLANAEDELLF